MFFGRWPIVAHDADLWYHLAAGRRLAETHSLPSVAWFSWLPDRAISDFYALFQIAVYATFELAGYAGLVVLRTGLFLVVATLVLATALRGAVTVRAQGIGALVATLVIFALLPRAVILRPHLVTYACLAAFLYLLEHEASWRWTPVVLFAIGLVQVNAHGVCYPVMLAVCGSYAATPLLERVRSRTPPSPEQRAVLLSSLVPMLSIFFSALGVSLLAIPFTPTRFARWYVSELAPVGTGLATAPLLSPQSAPILLALLCAAALIHRARLRELRLHHVLLLAAGVALLSRGLRFTHEFALLSLPILRLAASPRHGARGARSGKPAGTSREPAGSSRPWLAFAGGTVALLPAAAISMLLGAHRAWPFSPRGLPVGVARFLETQGDGGRVLNGPATGGYLEWALYGRYTIALDMDVPFVFSDEDFFAGMTWAHDADVFRRIVAEHSPDWLAVPLGNPELAEIVRGTSWTPVFVDDAAVLYVDASRHPEVAARFALRTIDPFALDEIVVSKLSPDARAPLRDEVDRLRSIDDRSVRVNSLGARLAMLDHDLPRAWLLASDIVRVYPERPEGHLLQGDVLFEKDPSKAREEFVRALARADERRVPLRKMRDCDHRLGNHARAYREGLDSVSGFPLDAGSQELYELGVLAMEAHQPSEARMWLRLALLRLPAGEAALGSKIATLLGGAAASGSAMPPR